MESLLVESQGTDGTRGEDPNDDNNDDDDDDDDDAPYLDDEAYTNYRDYINPDGSLTRTSKDMWSGVTDDASFNNKDKNDMDYSNTNNNNNNNMGTPSSKRNNANWNALVNPRPDIPDSYYSSASTAEPDATLEQLLEITPRGADEVDEDIHKQIMANEQGFQQQSKLFQDFLSGDAEGNDTAYMLREQRRRQEETETLLKLEQEMGDLAEFLDKEPREVNLILCSKCNCPLTTTEIEVCGPKFPFVKFVMEKQLPKQVICGF
jgi:hypothetical protein